MNLPSTYQPQKDFVTPATEKQKTARGKNSPCGGTGEKI